MFEALQAEFGIPQALSVVAGQNDLPKVVLTHASGARAEVYLHGGHVTSWTTAEGDELFFVSRESYFALERPIRGGIPIIFPQFGGGPLPQHGFARISDWQLISTALRDDGDISATLLLESSPSTLALWPHYFRLELEMQLSVSSLTVTMRVDNTDDNSFGFQAALHTYFGVADIHKTAVYGLQGVTLIDSLRDDAREDETREVIRFAEETDRIYLTALDQLHIADEGHGRTISIQKQHMPDVVVWNPWIDKAQRMRDFGDDEYLRMVCVETGIIAATRVLPAGERWEGKTMFTVGV